MEPRILAVCLSTLVLAAKCLSKAPANFFTCPVSAVAPLSFRLIRLRGTQPSSVLYPESYWPRAIPWLIPWGRTFTLQTFHDCRRRSRLPGRPANWQFVRNPRISIQSECPGVLPGLSHLRESRAGDQRSGGHDFPIH